MSTTTFRRSVDTIFTTLDEDLLALNVERGLCYGMEKVTARIWNMLDEPRSSDEIVAGLLQEYDVDPDRCRSEVNKLIEVLQTEGLVERV